MKQQGGSDSIHIHPKLRIHESSHLISKIAPNIHIIHIFSPKIIKTNEANFRELVQSLTGQRAHCKGSTNSSTNKITSICQPKASRPRKTVQLKGRSNVHDSNHMGVWNESDVRIVTPVSRKNVSISDMAQEKGGIPVSRYDGKVKKEFIGKTYKGENSNTGFFKGGFPDMGDFFQDPSGFSSLFSKYSQIFGGMP